MLRIYSASHCLSYDRTNQLIDFLRRQRPQVPVQVINVDEGNVRVPDYVFGTPTYVWNDEVIFLGNPSEEDLVKRIDHNGNSRKVKNFE